MVNTREENIHPINPQFGMFQSTKSNLQVDFSFEEERIKSFASWPVHFPVDPIRLAKAGFYYNGNEDEVICFSCHGLVKNWNYGDIVQKKHSDLFPDCDFINGRSNNKPVVQRKVQKQVYDDLKEKATTKENSTKLIEAIKTVNYTKMKSANERLKTFEKNWPHITIDGLKLAQAGFFYVGCDDKVQCPFCKGIVSNWEVNDNPFEEHKKHFPWCDYLSKDKLSPDLDKLPWFKNRSDDLCGNMEDHIPDQSLNKCKLLDKNEDHMKLEELGVNLYHSPAHPQQASLSARLRSFILWPATSPVSKEELAKAGFFYIGIGDRTKCFHCNGGLCNWEIGDDPWVEHAKWFCNCIFLRLNKGEKFVEDCLKKYSPKTVKEENIEHTSTFFSSEPLMLKVDEAMKSDMVKYVLDTGLFPHYVVRVAVLRRIEETGSSFSDMNELCLAVSYLKDEMQKMPLKSDKSSGLNFDNIAIRKCVIDDSKNRDTTGNSSTDELNSGSSASTASSSRNVAACINDKGVSTSDKTENQQIVKRKPSEDQCLCKICMDKEVEVVFLPCGHFMACTECAPAMELCSMCRKPIQATIRVYFS